MTGRNQEGLPPQVVASSRTPVAGPPDTGVPPTASSPRTQVRPLSPEEAQRLAKEARAQRAERATPSDGHRVMRIPTLPPAPHTPVRITPLVLVVVQMVLDIVSIAGAFAVAYPLRSQLNITGRLVEPATQVSMLAVTVGTILVTFYFSGLYNLKRGASRVDEFYKIAAAVSMGTVISLATNSLILGEEFAYSRQILLTGWVLSIAFVTVTRVLYGVVVGELRKRGMDKWRVLVVGTSPTAATVVSRLSWQKTLGYQVVGVIDETRRGHTPESTVGGAPVLGNLSRLAESVRKHRVDEVIVALTGASEQELRDIVELLQDEHVSLRIYPDAFQLMTQNEVSVAELSGLPLLSVKDVTLRGWNRRVKRVFDVLFSLVVLVLTAPLMLLIAIGVKLTSPGPVFFIQERVGLDAKPFRLVKFRTMRVDAAEEQTSRLKEGLPGWTVRNDPRRTSFGSFLRRFSLDELPQFYNVLVGEMSVVGPRPEVPEYVQEFAQSIKRYLLRHREKAGITGWAQVNGFRGDSSIEVRTALDLYYVENWSVLFDLKIILRTIIAMFRGKNAY